MCCCCGTPQASSVKGVCHGIFWYKDGENEVGESVWSL